MHNGTKAFFCEGLYVCWLTLSYRSVFSISSMLGQLLVTCNLDNKIVCTWYHICSSSLACGCLNICTLIWLNMAPPLVKLANCKSPERQACQGVWRTWQSSVFETVEKPTFSHHRSEHLYDIYVKGQVDDVFAGLLCHFATTSSD